MKKNQKSSPPKKKEIAWPASHRGNGEETTFERWEESAASGSKREGEKGGPVGVKEKAFSQLTKLAKNPTSLAFRERQAIH